MLVDSVTFEEQGIEPVTVKLPLERVPMKLKLIGNSEFVIVPVNAVPVCDTAIWPIGAARVVAPLTFKPCPDCVRVAIPEKVPWPWVDTVVAVQVPAIFRGELLEPPVLDAPLPPQPMRKNVTLEARSTLRLAVAMRFMCPPGRQPIRDRCEAYFTCGNNPTAILERWQPTFASGLEAGSGSCGRNEAGRSRCLPTMLNWPESIFLL
jgi:hypothetical protein